MTTMRDDMYGCAITSMKSYGGKQQAIVKHASFLDFRRMPVKHDKQYMAEAETSISFFVGFCKKKSVLRKSENGRKMEKAVSSCAFVNCIFR